MTGTTLDLGEARSTAAWVRRSVDAGAWRTGTIVDDLCRSGSTTPDAVAIVVRRGDETMRIRWADYVASVDRYAGALRELGVRRGNVVSVWLPNCRQLPALMLAVWKIGAILAQAMPTIGPRELERMLARLSATLCITSERHAGVPRAQLLAEVGARLPGLTHEVVLGSRNGGS